MANSTQVAKGFQMTNPGNIDSNRGPYPTLAAANAAIPNIMVDGRSFREGKFVDVGDKTYRWKGGFADTNLLPDGTIYALETITDKSLSINDDAGLSGFSIDENGEYWPPVNKPDSIEEDKLSPELRGKILSNTPGNLPFIHTIEDEFGFVAHAINDKGERYPPAIVFEDFGSFKDGANKSLLVSDEAADYIPNTNIQKNGIWNQWIEPIAVVWDNALYWCSIGDGRGGLGEIWLNKLVEGNPLVRKKIGKIRGNPPFTDDHNCPAILVDERTDAAFPLMIFQAEHNSHYLRVLKLDSLDPNTWEGKAWIDVGTEKLGYVSAFRNKNNLDEIIIFSRFAGQPRPWLFTCSSDNGNSFIQKKMFIKTDDAWMYIMARQSPGGNGIDFIFGSHPLNSSDTRLCVMSLSWLTGEVKSPSGAVAIQNFRSALVDQDFLPIDPFLFGDYIVQPQAGTTRRFCSMLSDVNGNGLALYTISPSRSLSMANFNSSLFRLVSFSWKTGAINFDIPINETGMPIERPLESFYFANGEIINMDTMVVFVYKNQSQIEGGTDTSGNDGATTGLIINFSDPNNLVKRQFTISKNKVIRPYSVSGKYLLYCECSKFIEYTNFKSNILVENLNQLL